MQQHIAHLSQVPRHCCQLRPSGLPTPRSRLRSLHSCTARHCRGPSNTRRQSDLSRMQTAASDTALKQAETSPPPLPPVDAGFEAAHAFSSYANWIVPGHVMLGRYPYVEPSRCRTHEQGEKQIQQLLEAGITTFISLQAETPAQLEMGMGGVHGFIPYAAVASLEATAMSGPPDMQEVTGLRNQYLDTFLPPRRKQGRKAAGQQQQDAANGSGEGEPERQRIKLQFLHFPVTDLSIPTTDQVRAVIGEVEAQLGQGRKVYLHCWGGRGRAGTFGACLLGAMYGMSVEEGLLRVQRAFATRGDGGYSSPETMQQVSFVQDYFKCL